MADLIKLDDSLTQNSAVNNLTEEPQIQDSGTSIKIAFTPLPRSEVQPSGAQPSGDFPGAVSEDSFENIFTKSAKKERDSKMMDSVVEQSSIQSKTRPILGSAPILEKTVEEAKIARQKSKLHMVQFLFAAVFMACLGAFLFFYTELSPDFTFLGTNTTSRLADINFNTRKIQTELNKYRYLSIQLDLNHFSYQADRFFGGLNRLNNGTVASADKNQLLADIQEAQIAMPALLTDIKKNLQKEFVATTFLSKAETAQTEDQILQVAEADLRNSLRDDRGKFSKSTAAEDVENRKLIDNSLKLVGNTSLFGTLQTVSVENFKKDLADYQQEVDPLKEKTLRDLIAKILSSTRSDLATIAAIKQNRIEWSTTIQQIETETMNVDKNYGQPLLYENLGGIVYSGYEFDASTNKIVLSGSTKTSDGSNFTLMSNLIDQLEQSQHFQEVDMRSFSKTKSAGMSSGLAEGGTATPGYLANFKIDLRLSPKSFSLKDKPLSLEANPAAEPVKR